MAIGLIPTIINMNPMLNSEFDRDYIWDLYTAMFLSSEPFLAGRVYYASDPTGATWMVREFRSSEYLRNDS